MYRLTNILSSWRPYGAAIALGVSLWAAHIFLPVQHNPLKPLSLDDPIGLTTYSKFTNLKYAPATCFRALDAAGVRYIKIVDETTANGCGFQNALMTGRVYSEFSRDVRMTCALAAALYTWEKQAASPAAEALLGSPLKRIETYGTYSCRNIAGSRQRSEHATANAIDIAGFYLEDGRYISVLKDWDTSGPEGKYLRQLHEQACRLFSVSLGPDYNAAHADHFHFDFGSGDSCR